MVENAYGTFTLQINERIAAIFTMSSLPTEQLTIKDDYYISKKVGIDFRLFILGFKNSG